MSKETLDTDRLNYLVWRYLVESGYTETAVRLQKEWNTADPQQFPFAGHVQNHTLVSILNRGLLYNVQERATVQQNGDVVAAASETGFFGPLMPPSPAAEEDFENARKRQMDNEQPQVHTGPPAKKMRLSNGLDPSLDPTAMDLDEEQPGGGENAYPSPDQAPSPVVATVGSEQGTQVEKVLDISSDTRFLELSDNPSAKNTILLQCEFNPQEPTILAAAGTDALARMWTLSPDVLATPPTETPGKPPTAPHRNILQDGVPTTTTATGLSWAYDGQTVAVSSEPLEEGHAKVEFWDVDGSSVASFNAFDSPVICLRWNPLNISCLAISPAKESKETLISLMYPKMGTTIKHVLPNHSLNDQPFDVAWTSTEEFVICGGNVLQSFRLVDGVLTPWKRYQTREGAMLSKVVFDPMSQLLATASETGTIDIWDQQLNTPRSTFNAHQGLITALAWQPLPMSIAAEESTRRILVSAGEDGAISLWDAQSPDTKAKSSMTMASAVVAMAFSPDGAYIAGGTNENVYIWKTNDVHVPKAIWTRPVESGWRSPSSSDSVPDEDQFSLCWDKHGQKFAYGVNSRLAVVQFGAQDNASADPMVT